MTTNKFTDLAISKTITLTSSLRLEQALKQAGIEDPAAIIKLSISGTITDDDMKYIRENMRETLQELDMSNASFIKNIIPDRAFANCTGLTSVTFPDSVVEIGYRAFSGCIGLTAVVIPASVTEIDTADIFFDFWTFAACDNLVSISVHPDNPVYASEDGVLLNKEKTAIIKCPNGRQGDYVIPDSVTDLGRIPFSYCTRLTSLMVSENHPEYSSEAGILFNKDKTELVCCPEGRQGDCVVPDSVVRFDLHAFSGCTGLTSIFIPASVVDFGTAAMDELRHPYAITKEERAFWYCTGLTSITVAQDHPLYASENGVMFNKDKTELILYPKGRQGDYVIPDSVVKVRKCAFRNCVGLTSLIISALEVEIDENAFDNDDNLDAIRFMPIICR